MGVNNLKDIKKICAPEGDRNIKRGDIFDIDAPTAAAMGSEQSGLRPAVVISNDVGNTHSPTVIIAYLTTKKKTNLPVHFDIDSSPRHSTVLCEQIASVSKARLKDYKGTLNEDELKRLDRSLAISLDIKNAIKKENIEFIIENNKLLASAWDLIVSISEAAKKINQIDEIAEAALNSQGLCFYEGNHYIKVDNIIREDCMDNIKNALLNQLYQEKKSCEKIIETLMKIDRQLPSSGDNNTNNSVEEKKAYLTSALKKKAEEMYNTGIKLDAIASNLKVDNKKLEKYLATVTS